MKLNVKNSECKNSESVEYLKIIPRKRDKIVFVFVSDRR